MSELFSDKDTSLAGKQVGTPRIMLVHGAGAAPRNAGDDAQALAVAQRLRRIIPGCGLMLARMYTEDDGSLWPAEDLVDSPHLYLLGQSALTRFILKCSRRARTKPLTALIYKGCLSTRVLRLLFAAWCKKVFGISPLIDKCGRRALENLVSCDAVYCSGGGNLNDIWLRQELLPRTTTYRVAHLLGKPVFVSGQGIGPLNSRLGKRLLRWGTRHVKVFGCRDREESVKLLTSLGVNPQVAHSLGDDAMDLAPSPSSRAQEILKAEGVPVGQFPLIAMHIRFNNFSADFRNQGIPFVAELCDALIEQCNCFIAFVPITHARERTYDHDIGDAFEVFAKMKQRNRAAFICGERYSPPEIKAVIAESAALVGFSYHAWVFSLTSGHPTFGLYLGEYFRRKSAGLFAWYDQPNWVWDISKAKVQDIITEISSALDNAATHKRNLQTKTQSLVLAVEKPARLLNDYCRQPSSNSAHQPTP
jgi:polysaccharide pyruvyl transferase WcaK-like protein